MDLSLGDSLSNVTHTTLCQSIKITCTLFLLTSILITFSIFARPSTRTMVDLPSHSRAAKEIDGHTRFLNHNYTTTEWGAKKRYLHELFGQGRWVEAWDTMDYEVPYINPCIDIPAFKWGKCLESNPNQGRRFMWKPNIGTLQPWSTYNMCEIMNGKNLLIAGDSLSQEFFLSMLSSLWATLIIPPGSDRGDPILATKLSNQRYNCLEICHDLYLSSCGSMGPVQVSCGDLPSFKIGYVHTDHLIAGENNWMSQVAAQNASVLIINTGAHYQEIQEELRIVNSSLAYLKSNFPELSILYRTTIAGHVNCDALFNSEPLQSIPDESHSNPLFHWADIRNRSLALQNFIESTYPEVVIVDVFNATSLRADSHPGSGDCLHYCLPGVPDDWVLFVYNALLQFHRLADNRPISIEIPVMLDKALITKYDGHIIKMKSGSMHYLVRNGSRHVFINKTSVPYDHVDILGDDHEMYAISIGKPLK